MTARPRLIVLRAGALGDFFLTLPALSALRRKFPTHSLTLAARADVLPLVHGILATDVMAFDSAVLTPLFTPDAELHTAVQALFAGTDLAVLWLPERIARIVAANLRRLDVARLISANPLPVARHATDHLVDTLAPLGIGPQADTSLTPLNITPALADPIWQAHALTTESRVIAMHIGSGGLPKCWPLSHFAALARQLAAHNGAQVIFISGPAEEEWLLSSEPMPPAFIHLHSPPLPTLAAVLARSALYIGNDSGVTHLAAALAVPTIALFGPTDPAIWSPRGAHVTIIRSPTGAMGDLTPEAVYQIVPVNDQRM